MYRIARKQYSALDGEGARRNGGRWNAVGLGMVYTASSPSLAALELLVHVDPDLAPEDLVLWTWRLPPGSAGHRADVAALPADWNTRSECGACQELGATWTKAGSLFLEVPSAVMPEEWNVLLNPTHPRMPSVQAVSERPFTFDARLL